MSFLQTALRRSPIRPGRTLAVAALLLAASAALAGEPPRGGWPWMRRPQVHGYNERGPVTPPPAQVTRPPVRYSITITILPAKVVPAKADVAEVVAHLPEHARLWVEGRLTRQRGMLREFRSPPLQPGHRYTYTARVAWFEGGHWVSQTQTVPVWAGVTTCLFLSKPSAVPAALDKLGPADQKLAREQKFCAVQPENLLGAMGRPVKVTIKGQPVFLCCAACVEQARSAPDQTLAKVRELRTKHAPASKNPLSRE
jgi:uncharacterized protein (TIGR03000 family)